MKRTEQITHLTNRVSNKDQLLEAVETLDRTRALDRLSTKALHPRLVVSKQKKVQSLVGSLKAVLKVFKIRDKALKSWTLTISSNNSSKIPSKREDKWNQLINGQLEHLDAKKIYNLLTMNKPSKKKLKKALSLKFSITLYTSLRVDSRISSPLVHNNVLWISKTRLKMTKQNLES